MGKVYLTLDEVLTRRSISRYELAKRTGIRYPIIDNYYKNKVVRYDSYVLEKICPGLHRRRPDTLRKIKRGSPAGLPRFIFAVLYRRRSLLTSRRWFRSPPVRPGAAHRPPRRCGQGTAPQ